MDSQFEISSTIQLDSQYQTTITQFLLGYSFQMTFALTQSSVIISGECSFFPRITVIINQKNMLLPSEKMSLLFFKLMFL